VVSLFLDLSKAFDTVNHQILLNKRKYYGLQQSEFNWFQSYLSNKKQQVRANGVASDTRFISTGVPQGSILGPLLFIIFINDLPKSSTFFSMRLYADDTSLTASRHDLDGLLCEINNHLPAGWNTMFTKFSHLCLFPLRYWHTQSLIYPAKSIDSCSLTRKFVKMNVIAESA